MEHLAWFTQSLARRPRLCGCAISSDYRIVGCTQGAGCWYHVFCQGVSWGVWESHAPPTPWAGVEPQLKGCVSTSRGEIPLPRPCQKGAGSGPCANVPNESLWPMLRESGLPQWVTVAYTNGWRTGLLGIR